MGTVKCPLCNVEMAISGHRYRTAGDDSPDTDTKLYIEQNLVCRNAQCANHGKVVTTVKTLLELTKD